MYMFYIQLLCHVRTNNLFLGFRALDHTTTVVCWMAVNVLLSRSAIAVLSKF